MARHTTAEHREISTEEVTLERRFRFSASHLYRRPEWSQERNLQAFGKCAIEPGHGHNYRLWVEVAGRPDPQTGFVVDLPQLDRWVEEHVVEPLDHRHLNHALEVFAAGGSIPSTENLLLWILGRLRGSPLGGVELVALRLEEDEDLAASWRRELAGQGPKRRPTSRGSGGRRDSAKDNSRM